MKKIKCYLTKRYNGLYLVTLYKPVIVEVGKTGHEDAYIRYGDPLGYINIPKAFIKDIIPNLKIKRIIPTKIQLYGDIECHNDFLVVLENNFLYTIYSKNSYIENVCSWFIEHMFGSIRKSRVYFFGEVL